MKCTCERGKLLERMCDCFNMQRHVSNTTGPPKERRLYGDEITKAAIQTLQGQKDELRSRIAALEARGKR